MQRSRSAESAYPSSLRLKTRWEFDELFRTGRRCKGDLVRLVFLREREGASRFGVTVSKHIACAVGRARGRRMMREAFRRLSRFVEPGCWVIASLKDSGLDSSAVDVFNDMRDLMIRAGLIERREEEIVWRC